MPLAQLRRLRWAVRAALLLGIAASVAANVLHAQPALIARVIAAWPPVALGIGLELVARVPSRRGRGAVRVVATAAIAGIAAWVSYWHMVAVAGRFGEDPVAARLLPLSVDGLIVVASVSLVELAARIRTAGSPPAADRRGTVNPALAGAVSGQVSSNGDGGQSRGPDGGGDGGDIAPADRRAAALAALLDPAADVAAVAAAAGVTAETVQRWADGVASRARRRRGGRRNVAAERSTLVNLTKGEVGR